MNRTLTILVLVIAVALIVVPLALGASWTSTPYAAATWNGPM